MGSVVSTYLFTLVWCWGGQLPELSLKYMSLYISYKSEEYTTLV